MLSSRTMIKLFVSFVCWNIVASASLGDDSITTAPNNLFELFKETLTLWSNAGAMREQVKQNCPQLYALSDAQFSEKNSAFLGSLETVEKLCRPQNGVELSVVCQGAIGILNYLCDVSNDIRQQDDKHALPTPTKEITSPKQWTNQSTICNSLDDADQLITFIDNVSKYSNPNKQAAKAQIRTGSMDDCLATCSGTSVHLCRIILLGMKASIQFADLIESSLDEKKPEKTNVDGDDTNSLTEKKGTTPAIQASSSTASGKDKTTSALKSPTAPAVSNQSLESPSEDNAENDVSVGTGNEVDKVAQTAGNHEEPVAKSAENDQENPKLDEGEVNVNDLSENADQTADKEEVENVLPAADAEQKEQNVDEVVPEDTAVDAEEEPSPVETGDQGDQKEDKEAAAEDSDKIEAIEEQESVKDQELPHPETSDEGPKEADKVENTNNEEADDTQVAEDSDPKEDSPLATDEKAAKPEDTRTNDDQVEEEVALPDAGTPEENEMAENEMAKNDDTEKDDKSEDNVEQEKENGGFEEPEDTKAEDDTLTADSKDLEDKKDTETDPESQLTEQEAQNIPDSGEVDNELPVEESPAQNEDENVEDRISADDENQDADLEISYDQMGRSPSPRIITHKIAFERYTHEPEDTHFLLYFVICAALTFTGYVIIMRWNRIVPSVIRRGSSSVARRGRSSRNYWLLSGRYRKLVGNLEEVMSPSAKSSNY